jgi:hypothetical protein
MGIVFCRTIQVSHAEDNAHPQNGRLCARVLDPWLGAFFTEDHTQRHAECLDQPQRFASGLPADGKLSWGVNGPRKFRHDRHAGIGEDQERVVISIVVTAA